MGAFLGKLCGLRTLDSVTVGTVHVAGSDNVMVELETRFLSIRGYSSKPSASVKRLIKCSCVSHQPTWNLN